VSKLLRRHFVAVAVDANSAPPEIRAAFTRTGGNAFPFLLYVNDRGQYLNGSSGGRSPEDVRGDLDKALTDKSLAMPKNRESELAKLVEELEKQLDAKKHKEATATFNKILALRGYAAGKDKAWDLMDKAQEDGLKGLEQALSYAGRDEYAKAKEALEKIPKDAVDLPVAKQAQEHLAALKLIEGAHQATQDKKGNWRQIAVQRLVLVLKNHSETPYANLALQRQNDLIKGK
jgi:hypothetical protein